MKKLKINLKKYGIFVFSVLLVCLCFAGFSSNSGSAQEDSSLDTNVQYDYVETVIKIDEKKVCDITEIITVTYKNDKINVGLSRNISKVSKITRLVNGKKYVRTTYNKLTLVSVTMDGEEEYAFVEDDGEYFYINTGKDYDYKVGQHVYEIEYLYDMGEDFISAFDDFTFDIMSYGFKSAVGGFSAKITFPKEFLNGKLIDDVLSFRSNDMVAVSNEAVNMSYDENSLTISCSCDGFAAYHGLTMQLILPNKYFDTHYSPNALYYVVLALSLIGVIAIALIIFFNRRIKNQVVTPEFYPPKGYSPIDVAKAFRGHLKNKDFSALILEWASRGLVSIKIDENDKVILTKLKPYEPPIGAENLQKSKEKERACFDGLFSAGPVYDSAVDRFKPNAQLQIAVRNLFQKEPKRRKILLWNKIAIHILAVLPILFFLIWAAGIGISGVANFILLLFPIIGLLFATEADMSMGAKIVIFCAFGLLPLGILISRCILVYDVFCLLWIVTAIFLAGNLTTLLVRAFSKEELQVRGKILGFRNFLVTAELDRLNMMLEDDPQYFYNILPYCYVLGITKKMRERFNALNINPDYLAGHSVDTVCTSLWLMVGVSGRGFGNGSGGFGGSGSGFGGSSGGGGGGGGCGGR